MLLKLKWNQVAGIIVCAVGLALPAFVLAADSSGLAEVASSVTGVSVNTVSGGYGGEAQGLTLWHTLTPSLILGLDYFRGQGTVLESSGYAADGNRQYSRIQSQTWRLFGRIHPYEDSSFNFMAGLAQSEARGTFGFEGQRNIETESHSRGIYASLALGNRWTWDKIHAGVDWVGIMPNLQSETQLNIRSQQGALIEDTVSRLTEERSNAATQANELFKSSMELYWLNVYVGIGF